MLNNTEIHKPLTKTNIITAIALLAAVSYLLSLIEFPMPLSPSFARIDLSDLPAVLAAFLFGPLAGVAVEFLKNGLGLLTTTTAGVGELANFLIGNSFVLTAGVIYKNKKTKKNAILACIVASLVMGIVAALANYFILLPMFEMFMPLDQVIASFAEFIPFINTKLDVVLYSALPASFLKGLLISTIAMLTYKNISHLFAKYK